MPKFRKKPVVVEAFQVGVHEEAKQYTRLDELRGRFYCKTAQGEIVYLWSGKWIIPEKDQPPNDPRAYPITSSILAETYEPVEDEDGD